MGLKIQSETVGYVQQLKSWPSSNIDCRCSSFESCSVVLVDVGVGVILLI